MSIEDAKESENKTRIVSEKIVMLWRPDAENVLNLVDDGNSLVVVAGPGGSGKSMNLTPNIVNISIQRGYQPVYFDCQSLPNPIGGPIWDSFKRRKKDYHPERGLVILDELPYLADEHVIERDLFYLHKQKSASVVALVRKGKPEEIEFVDKLMQAEESLGGKVAIYELQPKQLPKDLARKFLVAFYRTPPAIVNYIIDTFPLYPRVIDGLKGGKNQQEVNELWRSMGLEMGVGFGFSPEEAELVNRRIVA